MLNIDDFLKEEKEMLNIDDFLKEEEKKSNNPAEEEEFEENDFEDEMYDKPDLWLKVSNWAYKKHIENVNKPTWKKVVKRAAIFGAVASAIALGVASSMNGGSDENESDSDDSDAIDVWYEESEKTESPEE